MRKGKYDYIKDIAQCLSEDQLVDVFGQLALLNEQPACRQWVEVIAAVGVDGLLALSKHLGGSTLTIPTFYQVLMVFSAMSVIELEPQYGYAQAKDKVIGGLLLDGFDELVTKIKSSTSSFGRGTD